MEIQAYGRLRRKGQGQRQVIWRTVPNGLNQWVS